METTDIETLSETTNSAPKYIPIEDIIALRDRDFTLKEIGKLHNISESAVSQRLIAVGYDKDRLDRYRKSRADILAFKQSKMDSEQFKFLESTDAKITNWKHFKDSVTSQAIAYDKECLELGKPTQIVDINQVNLEIKQIEARLELKVKKELSTDK